MQNERSADVNTPAPTSGTTETEESQPNSDRHAGNRPGGDETIPVPPDKQPVAPVEEPPGTGGAPVGDVDDSPTRIAGEESQMDPRF